MKAALLLLLALGPGAWAADAPPPGEREKGIAEARAPHCLRDTGSRIKRPRGECVAASGRVIDRDELDHRAHTDLGRHLQDLHPGISLGP